MSTFLIIVITILGTAAIYAAFVADDNTMAENILWNWSHYFPEQQFSTVEFYAEVNAWVREHQIPDVQIQEIELSEYGSLTGRHRKYLRVKSGIYLFDICAAPYGKGFFVSWWMGQEVTFTMRLLLALPLIGGYMHRRLFKRTYYGWDTEDMFEYAIHEAVLRTIEKITQEKGLRALSETQRRPQRVNR